MKQIERIINPEMNRNRFNEGMTSINALISTTVETYFDKLKSLRYSKHVPSPFMFELRDLQNLYKRPKGFKYPDLNSANSYLFTLEWRKYFWVF